MLNILKRLLTYKGYCDINWINDRLYELFQTMYVTHADLLYIVNLGVALNKTAIGKPVISKLAIANMDYISITVEDYYDAQFNDPRFITNSKIQSIANHYSCNYDIKTARWMVRAMMIHFLVAEASRLKLTKSGKRNLDKITKDLSGGDFHLESNALLTHVLKSKYV